MARRDFGISGEIELAQMPPLPPIAQMMADMDGLGALGLDRGSMCVHERKLAREIRPSHYPGGNRTASRPQPHMDARESNPIFCGIITPEIIELPRLLPHLLIPRR
jgi:hypothetical protein